MSETSPQRAEIYADLEELYRAGRKDFPTRAHAVNDVVTDMTRLVEGLNERAATLGDPTVTTNMLSVLADVHEALRRTVITLNNCGVGLVAVADDYCARDHEAREHLGKLSDPLDPFPTKAIPEVSVPAPVDKGSLTEDGVADDYESSPDAPPPSSDLDERNRRYQQGQAGIDESKAEGAAEKSR